MDPRLRIVHRYLDHNLNDAAHFLSERLMALEPDQPAWAQFCGLACLRLGKYKLARDYTRDHACKGKHLGCMYTYAQASLAVGEHMEGISVLEGALQIAQDAPDIDTIVDQYPDETQRFTPDLASVHHLYGCLYKKGNHSQLAADSFALSLAQDRFLWSAFAGACNNIPRTTTLPVDEIFTLQDPEPSARNTHNTDPCSSPLSAADSASEPLNANDSQMADLGPKLDDLKIAGGCPLDSPKKQTSSGSASEIDDEAPQVSQSINVVGKRVAMGYHPSESPRKSIRLQSKREKEGRGGRAESSTHVLHGQSVSAAASSEAGSQADQTTEIQSQDPPSAAEPGKEKRREPISPSSGFFAPELPFDAEHRAQTGRSKLQALMNILGKAGSAYYHLRRHEPKRALRHFATLPEEQQDTFWVLAQVGRAHYEQMEYEEARATFLCLRDAAPSWVEELDIFSTTLWHLKDELGLAVLNNQLFDTACYGVHHLCAMANLCSLHGEHTNATAHLKLACSLFPQGTHPYTLLGFEYVELAAYDKATEAFRNALLRDSEYYPAWIGLGQVEEKLERMPGAVRCYETAERINPWNALIPYYAAKVLQQEGEHEQALWILTQALSLSPPKVVAGQIRTQIAHSYIESNRPQEAVEELNQAGSLLPGEPRIHFLKGKALSRMGPENRHEAIISFSVAHSLSPYDRSIKEALVALDDYWA